jgi:hypothetical protein
MVFSCSDSFIATRPIITELSTNTLISYPILDYTPVYPLKVSANKRYLVDQNSNPVFLSGDAAWSLIVQLTNEDVITYLANRHDHGFNTILVELIEHHFSTYAPNNIYNVPPFTGKVFTTPNETYFAHADYVITNAAQYNMTVFLAPLYLGYPGTEEGWDSEIAAASIEDMQSWGTYVGNRYKDFTNIVWVIGGDQDPTSLLPKVNAFANALVAADPNHLVTFHDIRGTMAVDHLAGASWLTLNDIYTNYLGTAGKAQTAYAYFPTLPFFQIEGYYENDHSMTTQNLRAQAYWTVLAGGCGYIFGNTPLWEYDFEGGDWKTAMDAAGSVSMSYAASLFRSLAWQNLVPDTTHIVGTAGYGTIGTANYITTGRVADGSLVMSYFPSAMTLTIDMTQLNGWITGRWYDPTNGAYNTVSGSPFPNTGTHNFTPTGYNAAGDSDWVLILDVNSQISWNYFLPFIRGH